MEGSERERAWREKILEEDAFEHLEGGGGWGGGVWRAEVRVN